MAKDEFEFNMAQALTACGMTEADRVVVSFVRRDFRTYSWMGVTVEYQDDGYCYGEMAYDGWIMADMAERGWELVSAIYEVPAEGPMPPVEMVRVRLPNFIAAMMTARDHISWYMCEEVDEQLLSYAM